MITASNTATSGVGTGNGTDARIAAETAVTEALRPLDGRTPDLVLVYASVRYDLEAVLKTVNAAVGDAVVAGASTSGQLESGRLTEPGSGVAVLALAGGGYRFGLGYATGIMEDPAQVGRAMTRAALEDVGTRSPHEAVLVLSDGLAGDQQELLNGIFKVTGFQIPVIGGAAADDRQLKETFVFAGDKVLTDAAVALWIGSDRPLRVVGGHGWKATSLPLMVTGVDGQYVTELGGRPALEVYRENFMPPKGVEKTLYRKSGGYHSEHAFGLIQPDGSLLIRGAYIDGDGKLRTFSPLPPYSAVQVVSCQPEDLLEVGEETVESAIGDDDPSVVLVFDCVARLDVLRDRGHEEARRLQEAAGKAPTFGFYTYGEFARTTGVAGYHNATIVALAL